MAMEINSIEIPATMVTRNYGYDWQEPAILGYTGSRAPITATTGATLTLTFPRLDETQWTWWITTLLSAADYAEFSQCILYDNDKALTTFSHCIVYKPVRGKFLEGYHTDVTVFITDIY